MVCLLCQSAQGKIVLAVSLSVVLVTYYGPSLIIELLSMSSAYNTKNHFYLLRLESFKTIIHGYLEGRSRNCKRI